MSRPEPPTKFSPTVSQKLGTYVYLLRDPRNGEPFYVGKGRGSRVYHHVWDVLGRPELIIENEKQSDTADDSVTLSEKRSRISDILDAGKLPEHWIVRHNINPETDSDKSAFAIEQALIDGIGLAVKLTNKVGGHTSSELKFSTAEDLALRYGAPPAPDLPRPCALVVVNASRDPDVDVYEAARCCWRAGAHMRDVPNLPIFVFADDVIRGVYRATSWELGYKKGKDQTWRWTGTVDADLGKSFINTSLEQVRKARATKTWRQHGWHPYP